MNTPEEKVLRRILEVQEHTLRVLERIERLFPHRYSIKFTFTSENPMAIGQLSSPGTAVLLLALLDNGEPYVEPSGSAYVFTPTLTASDASVTITPDASTPNQFDVVIPAGDSSASVIFSASATAPDGSTASGTLTIPFAPEPQKFTISITQTG